MTTAVKYFDKTAKENSDTPKNLSEAKTKLLYGGIGLRGERDKKRGRNNTGKESLKGGAIGAGIGAAGTGLVSAISKRKINLKTLKSMGKGGAIVGGLGAVSSALNYQGGRQARERDKDWNNMAKAYLKEQRKK